MDVSSLASLLIQAWVVLAHLITLSHVHAQYFGEVGQPQRTNFIGRRLSYHANSLSILSLGYHPGRHSPYATFID